MNNLYFEQRKAAAIDDLRSIVRAYEGRFYARKVYYNAMADSFCYCGRAYNYTSGK